MPEVPSYRCSMTSQLFLVVTLAQLILGFWLMRRGNTEAAIALVGGAFTTIKGLYDQRRADERMKNGNPVPPPTEPVEVKPSS